MFQNIKDTKIIVLENSNVNVLNYPQDVFCVSIDIVRKLLFKDLNYY